MSYLLPPIDTWEQWAAVFTDVDLWKPVVSEICAREGITSYTIEAGYPGTNAVFLLDRKYVIKVYNPVWKDFAVERELHAALEDNRMVPLPKMVSSGQFVDRIEWDYLITDFVEGQPVRELRDDLTRIDLLDIASRLGEIIRALHDTDISALENLRRHETGPQLAARRKVKAVAEIRDKRLLPDTVLDELASFLESTALDHGDHEAVLVHGDLTEDHLLLKRPNGRWAITGLLDLGDARVCPREYEWPALWLNLFGRDVEALRAFFNSYDPTVLEDRDFTRRAFVWSLLHDFGTEIVENAVNRTDAGHVRSLDDLRELLWPSDIFSHPTPARS